MPNSGKLLLLLSVLSFGACAGEMNDGKTMTAQSTNEKQPIVGAPPEDRKRPEKIRVTPGAPPSGVEIKGEVPQEIVRQVKTDLARRLGHNDFTLQKALAVQWPDGSLGCPKPGMMYTQALVPGYQVVFKSNEGVWDYHLNQQGRMFLCQPESFSPAPQSDQGELTR